MAKHHTVSLGEETFTLQSGQILLDGAIAAGVGIPHDCRAGRCGSCMTEIKAGITLGGETRQLGTVYACQTRVFSDLKIAIEAVPAVEYVRASISALRDLTSDVVELEITPSAPFSYLPGQYCRFTFNGFPTRCFSPTAALDGSPSDGKFHLQIKRVRQGRISTNLGEKIKVGHSLTIEGPFGHGFLRPGLDKRLVLVAGGTGFAPIWSVAEAALRENPHRSMLIVVGVRKLGSFYMGAALDIASKLPNVEIIATAEEHQTTFHAVQFGTPAEHVPSLSGADVVYAAGAPVMVDAVGVMAEAAGAKFYCDPFESTASETGDWITRAMTWLRTG